MALGSAQTEVCSVRNRTNTPEAHFVLVLGRVGMCAAEEARAVEVFAEGNEPQTDV